MSLQNVLTTRASQPIRTIDSCSYQRNSSLARKIEISRSAVHLDASHMQGKSRQTAVNLLAKALFVAQLMEKDELLVTQVMPWIDTYCGRRCSVAEAEPWFASMLEDACDLLEWERPVTRMSSRYGEIELRCYLGREKPTDYRYLDDWYCEARESFAAA